MKGAGVWFFLSCKRYLRKVSFLLILLVLPAVTFFVRRLEREEGQEVRIAVCAEGQTENEEKGHGEEKDGGQKDSRWASGGEKSLETELLEALVGQESGGDSRLFRFYLCEDEEQVKVQVVSRQAECGYVIGRDLRRRLDERDYKRCIRVYSAPSTVLASLSTEVVFASLMKLYDREIFLNYVVESETVQGTETAWETECVPENQEGIKALAGELYDKWLENGSTFGFKYRYQNQGRQEDGTEIETEEPVRVFPVRGIVAVYLLLTGLYSAVMLGYDERKGLFLPLAPGKRLVCRLMVLGAPVFLGVLSSIGALVTGECLQEIMREMWVMGIYALAVCGFSYGVKAVCRTPQVVCCMIPLLLVGSLVFAPVFVDVRQFFPDWGWMEKLFLPSYYLRAF